MDNRVRQGTTTHGPELRDDEGPASGAEAREFVEEGFLLYLRRVARPLIELGPPAETEEPGGELRRVFRAYADRALELEIFLDECHAKSNRRFAPLREFVASVRGFAKIGQYLVHILRRTGNDLAAPGGDQTTKLLGDTGGTLVFVRKALSALWCEVANEISVLAGPVTGTAEGGGTPRPHEPALPLFRLPANMGQASVPEQRRRIAELGAKFLGHRKILERQSGGARFDDPAEMRRFVLEVSDEQQVRYFETRIHNLLSAYDTFVQNTPVECQDPDLPRFRGHVALLLLLLECMGELVHFYERHENDIRSEDAKDRVAQLVDKSQVLDRILNYALYYVRAVMDGAAPIAEQIVQRYTSQARLVCPLPPGLHIHARPASLITRVVEHYATPVTMTVGDTTCYAGSILQVLMAAGAHPEVKEVVFQGDRRTLQDLRLLFEHRFGERGAGPLPAELSYLGG